MSDNYTPYKPSSILFLEVYQPQQSGRTQDQILPYWSEHNALVSRVLRGETTFVRELKQLNELRQSGRISSKEKERIADLRACIGPFYGYSEIEAVGTMSGGLALLLGFWGYSLGAKQGRRMVVRRIPDQFTPVPRDYAPPTEQDLRRLEKLYARRGFIKGLLFGGIGGAIVGKISASIAHSQHHPRAVFLDGVIDKYAQSGRERVREEK